MYANFEILAGLILKILQKLIFNNNNTNKSK